MCKECQSIIGTMFGCHLLLQVGCEDGENRSQTEGSPGEVLGPTQCQPTSNRVAESNLTRMRPQAQPTMVEHHAK